MGRVREQSVDVSHPLIGGFGAGRGMNPSTELSHGFNRGATWPPKWPRRRELPLTRTFRKRPPSRPDRRHRNTERQGGERLPGLRICLAALPDVRHSRQPPDVALHASGRGSVLGLPGGGWPRPRLHREARAAVSRFDAAVGMQQADNPVRHPVVAE